jgi:hypothetical protein
LRIAWIAEVVERRAARAPAGDEPTVAAV